MTYISSSLPAIEDKQIEAHTTASRAQNSLGDVTNIVDFSRRRAKRKNSDAINPQPHKKQKTETLKIHDLELLIAEGQWKKAKKLVCSMLPLDPQKALQKARESLEIVKSEKLTNASAFLKSFVLELVFLLDEINNNNFENFPTDLGANLDSSWYEAFLHAVTESEPKIETVPPSEDIDALFLSFLV